MRCRRQLRSLIDRRLTWGETWEGALDEIRVYLQYRKLTRLFLCTTTTARLDWPGLPNRMLLPDLESGRSHFTVKALVNAYEGLFGKAPALISGPSRLMAYPSWVATAFGHRFWPR